MNKANQATRHTRTEKKLAQLQSIFLGGRTMLIVLQDNPDPDSIASAVALRKLANSFANLQCSLTHGGRVGRAENRALVKYLSLNLRLSEELDFHSYDLIAVVDTQPWTGNNSLPQNIEPDIVIDHHRCRNETRNCRFTDIRSGYGATATILYEYLNKAQIPLDVPLATALLYAIRSDTQDLGRDTTKADIEALIALYPLANKRMLSEIQRGRVQRGYYQMLGNGLKNAQVVGNAIFSDLGEIDNPDMVAEIADLLLRDDETNWTMCYAQHRDKMLVSLRTSQESVRADRVIRHVVGKKGTGGGHPSYAGGQIPIAGLTPAKTGQLKQSIQKRFLTKVLAKGAATAKVPLIETVQKKPDKQ